MAARARDRVLSERSVDQDLGLISWERAGYDVGYLSLEKSIVHIEFFQIPLNDEQQLQTFKQFMQSQRIISIEKHFVADGPMSFWAICVTYMPKQKLTKVNSNKKTETIDYKTVLSPKDFALYCQLKVCRQSISDTTGIAIYNVFTNKQLSELAQQKPLSKSQLEKIDGIGKSRTDKYAETIIKVVSEFVNHQPINDEPVEHEAPTH